MGEYHDLYLKSDILLLADVFEHFREASQANYGLDPTHYLTSPGLAWDAMLRITAISLELRAVCCKDQLSSCKIEKKRFSQTLPERRPR